MFRFNFDFTFEKPKWLARLFPCKHNVVSVTENPYSRYGTQTSYMYCMDCGRKAMEISDNCNHVANWFGRCLYCQQRVKKFDCKHVWTFEVDTTDAYCEWCGEWQDVINNDE